MDGTYYNFNVLWDFGDGKTSTSKTITRTYTNPGVYNVVLKVSAIDNNLWQNTMYDWAYLTIIVVK